MASKKTIVFILVIVVMTSFGCTKKEQPKKTEPFGVQIQVTKDLKIQGAVEIDPWIPSDRVAPEISAWLGRAVEECKKNIEEDHAFRQAVNFRFKWKDKTIKNLGPLKTPTQKCITQKMLSQIPETMEELFATESRTIHIQVIDADYF